MTEMLLETWRIHHRIPLEKTLAYAHRERGTR
jgi:hypothetical protein